MSNTLPNITIPKDVWLDVHAELSFTANVSVTIQNIGKSDLYYSISAVDPTSANTAYQILKRGQFYTSLPGGQKLWVFSAQQGNKINAEETDKRSATIVIGDLAGRSAMASIPGELHTAFKIDDISVNFQYGISTHDIVNGGNTTGTGVVGTFKAMATVSTGSGVGAAELISRSAIRYKAGNECQGALSHIFATPEVNVNQFCGLMNNDDGFTFGYKDLAFGVYFIEGGNNPIFTAQADFNRDKLDGTGASGYDINPQTDQVFRVSYTWHGMLPALFEVWGGLDRGWILCHSMEFTNSATETHLENPNLPGSIKIERISGTGANLVMFTGSWRGGVIASGQEDNIASRWFGAFVLNRAKTSDPDHVMTIRSKDVFAGKINHIRARVKILVSTNSTNKDLVFKATSFSLLSGAEQAAIEAGFVDINTDDSVMEKSDVETTITSGPLEFDAAVLLTGGQRANTDIQGFDIFPGEDIVFFVETSGTPANGTFSFQLNEEELF